MDKLKLGVLVSGNGSNLQAIMDQAGDGRLNAEVRVVLSDNDRAFAIERAKGSGIPVATVDYTSSPRREDVEDRIISELKKRDVGLVVLAGFMKLLTRHFVTAFPMRIMNIHPALLPSFPGMNVIQKAIDYGVKFTGCTVHFIDEGADTGPIIVQAAVPVMDGDTEETLARRIHEKEHIIYPLAIQLFAEGRLEIQGRRVLVKDYSPAGHDPCINPYDPRG
ncbi:MAG: phosphoribosylglycinamide formyltransferase [Deltaproteobacteria bacterium]|nr:phosphoribosylglycinamide formyltransferase [Deltaproteobacteria bacterium]